MNIYYFICVLWCSALVSMHPKWCSKDDKATIDKYTSLPIVYSEHNAPIFRLIFEDTTKKIYKPRYFYRIFDEHDGLYLIPLKLYAGRLPQLARDYRLLESLEQGNSNKFDAIAADEDNLKLIDKRYAVITYQIYTAQNNPASLQDLAHNQCYPLTLRVSPRHYPGTITLGWTSLKHAYRGGSITLYNALCRAYHMVNTKTMRILTSKKYQESQEAHQDALPALELTDSNPPALLDTEYQGYQIDTVTMHINKEHVTIYAHDYIGQPMDLTLLSILYALIIAYNKPEGSRLANLYPQWRTCANVRHLALRYVIDELKKYKEDLMVFDNLVLLAKNIWNHHRKTGQSIEYLEEDVYITILCFLLLEHHRTKSMDKHIQELLQCCITLPTCNKLLRDLCYDEYRARLYAHTIKPCMQRQLMKRALTLLLNKSPHLTPYLAQQIVEYNDIDDAFIKSLREKLGVYKYTFYE